MSGSLDDISLCSLYKCLMFSAALRASDSGPFLDLFNLSSTDLNHSQRINFLLHLCPAAITHSVSRCSWPHSYPCWGSFYISLLLSSLRPLLKIPLFCDTYNRKKKKKDGKLLVCSVCRLLCQPALYCCTSSHAHIYLFQYLIYVAAISKSSILVQISDLRVGRRLLLHFYWLLHLY